jgi:hypothetical protein
LNYAKFIESSQSNEVVCWHGSLNILSHLDTEESMTRIEGTDFASQLLKSIECGELVDRTNERIEDSQMKA